MEDSADQLIRRALARQPPPRLGPTFVEDVMRRVATADHLPVDPAGTRVRRRLAAAVWLLTGAASVAVLASVEWSSASRALAWGFGLLLVPAGYSATLWPRGFAALVARCGGPLPEDGRGETRFAGSLAVRERG